MDKYVFICNAKLCRWKGSKECLHPWRGKEINVDEEEKVKYLCTNSTGVLQNNTEYWFLTEDGSFWKLKN